MKTLTLLFCSYLLAAALQAQIIHVPAEYATIQQGINAATSGDTVLVAEGTYFEQINFKGKKPLVVASQFMKDGDTSHIRKTIIDGSQLTNKDSASVVYFISGEDTTSVLCGFTITKGKGTTIDSPAWLLAKEGGGIFITGSGATIKNNIITQNKCEAYLYPNFVTSIGGGIATEYDKDDFWIIIENNIIDSNFVISDSYNSCSTGGGIAILKNCRIVNNVIKNNVAKILDITKYWSQGAGAMVFADSSLHRTAIIQHNVFQNNINNSNNAFGGGMKVAEMHVICTHNTFKGNRTESDISITDCWGAGLEAVNFFEGSQISNNIFEENYSEKTDAGLMLFSRWKNTEPILVENNYFINNVAENMGGAFGTYDCHVLLQNNVFSGNHAGTNGGALYLSDTYGYLHLATLVNNSFSNNSAKNVGGAIFSSNAKPLIINSVFWDDTANKGQEIFSNISASLPIEIANSTINPVLISGYVVDGGGNLNQDPMFMDTVLLTLSPSSNCFNKGTLTFTCQHGEMHNCPLYDITGASRPLGTTVDMGAYEYDAVVGIENLQSRNPDFGIENYPNPYTGSTTFTYMLPKSTQVQLQVFNNLGLLVAKPVNEFQQIGEHKVVWNAEGLPAGIYYCRLQAGNQQRSVKIIKMK
jgi:hypothetical protein